MASSPRPSTARRSPVATALLGAVVLAATPSPEAAAACSGSICGTAGESSAVYDCETTLLIGVANVDPDSYKELDSNTQDDAKYGSSSNCDATVSAEGWDDAWVYYRDADADQYIAESSVCCVFRDTTDKDTWDLTPLPDSGTLVGYVLGDNCYTNMYYYYYISLERGYSTTQAQNFARSACNYTATGTSYAHYGSSNYDCDDSDPDINDELPYYIDADGDGYGDEDASAAYYCPADSAVTGGDYVANQDDCDDGDSSINPGSTVHEVCDTSYPPIDEDCDGKTESADSDVTGTVTYYPDADGDGFGDEDDDGTEYCVGDQPSGYTRNHTDCDDTESTAYPTHIELCDDGIDNDCDGEVDEDDAGDTWYRDDDGDGYGDAAYTTVSCVTPDGYVLNDDDCDDDDSSAYPGADEICSGVYEDCDSRGAGTEAPDDELDLDGDGYVECTYKASTWKGDATVEGGDDCEPDLKRVYPGASEICDGQYNDCEDPDYDASGAPDDELDYDGDGYVECDGYRATTWVGDAGVFSDNDCDNLDAAVYPGADEICDGQWNDCEDPGYDADTAPDDELDFDLDGYVSYVDCDYDPLTWAGDADIVGGDDCNDDDDTVYPSADEACDGQYNDCSDPDYDPYGTPATEQDDDGDYRVECHFVASTWEGYSGIVGGDDCDDTDALVYDGADEICDGRYNDCGDRSYDADSAPDDELDEDADGYVECADFAEKLWEGDAGVVGGDDCDPDDGAVFPTAAEICDGQYNDCQDDDYDARGAPEDELDADGDGYVPYEDCDYDTSTWAGDADVIGGDDCDDDDNTIYPAADEICDGQFNDCDDPDYDSRAAPDDERDDDGDYLVECHYVAAIWVGYSGIIGGDDCDDTDAEIYPGAEEVCDGHFNDCDDPDYDALSSPDDEFDADADGYVSCDGFDVRDWAGDPSVVGDGDCDTYDGTVYPSAPEICDGQYNDCEDDDYDKSGAPEDELDADADGYVPYEGCDYDPLTWVGDDDVIGGDDCDDEDDTVYPGADEVCDGQYNNCEDSLYDDRSAPSDEKDDDGD